MDVQKPQPARPYVPVTPAPTTVHVCLRDGQMELRFTPGFKQADVEVVKSIRGRRWNPKHRIWVLPHTPKALDTLKRLFGSRLAVSDQAADDSSATRAQRYRAQSANTSGESVRRPEESILEAMRRAISAREYSPKTGIAYLGWARRFLRFHAGAANRPETLDASHAKAFLEHLATKRLAAMSRNQAASALSFMFKEVLGRDELGDIPRAKGPTRVPTVLSHREVLRVLRELVGKYFLIVVLLYSAGLRLEECLRLRAKDIDFELRQILVRDGKGRKDRYVPLARRATDLLRAQVRHVAELQARDRADGHGWAPLPGAMHRKDPEAGYELGWQFVFPASSIIADPATGRTGRWPLHATAVQRQVKRAVRRSGVTKRATCHTFRHSFATEALRGGCDIRTLQHVMGHKDIRTTTIYLHVVEQTGLYVRSPLDRPDDPEEYETDPVGRPWAQAEMHWDLAAKQWSRKRTEADPAPSGDSGDPGRKP